MTTAGLFVVEMLVEVKNLLQLGEGQSWQSCRVLGRGRVGYARRCAWLWTLGCRVTSAFAWSLCMREHMHMYMDMCMSMSMCACEVPGLELCCVRTGCVVGCSALQDAAWRGAEPFGTHLLPKSRFFSVRRGEHDRARGAPRAAAPHETDDKRS